MKKKIKDYVSYLITYNFAAAQQPEGLFPEAIEQNIVVM